LFSPFKDLINLGSRNLVTNTYNGSLLQLLSNVYPDYNWLPWKFAECPLPYWDDVKNQRKFLDWAAKELNIKEMSDWYNVTNKVINVLPTINQTLLGIV
jgi:hypothetical protein